MTDTPKPSEDKSKEPTKPVPFTKPWADKLDKDIAQDQARAKAKTNPKKPPPRRN